MKGVGSHYRGYCVNQSNAARTLVDLKTSDRELRSLLDVCHLSSFLSCLRPSTDLPSVQGLRVKNLELEHLLLEPMQRLTRYPLLINQVRPLFLPHLRLAHSSFLQIIRYTEPDHPDHPALSRALQISEATLNEVNEAVRTHENDEKLAYYSDNFALSGMSSGVRLLSPTLFFSGLPLTISSCRQHLNLTAPTRLLGKRQILREGKAEKARSGRKLSVYLFSDLLIFTEGTAGPGEIVYRYVRYIFLSLSLSCYSRSPRSRARRSSDLTPSTFRIAHPARRVLSSRTPSSRQRLYRHSSRRVDPGQGRQPEGGGDMDEGD